MRILIDIGHPGHVHFFKHAVWEMQKTGHEVLFSARDKDVTISLLKHYNFNYRILSAIGAGTLGLIREFLQRENALIQLIRKYKPHITTGIGGEFIAPVAKMLGVPVVVFTDSEPVPVDKVLTYPIVNAICTPTCFQKDLGRRHIRYDGYHELAYLSPDYFTPDSTVLDEIGLNSHERFIVLRFVAWKASHDIGQQGFSLEQKMGIVQKLSHYARVFITSEKPLPKELEPFRLVLPAHRIHDLMYFAELLMGDGATMATEAAILGTPAVRSSSMALNMGNFIELMNKYKLVFSYYDPEQALQQAVKILESPNSKSEWHSRRNQMLGEKIDVTKFIVQTIQAFSEVRQQGL